MGNRKKEQTCYSFQELTKAITLLPELPDVTSETSDLEEQARRIREGAEKAGNWTKSAVAFLEQTENFSLEARELVEEKIRQTSETLNQFLHKEPIKAYRRAVWKAVLLYYMSKEVYSAKEVKNLFRALVDKGYLEENDKGILLVGNVRYNVPVQAAFNELEIKEISKLVEVLSTKVLQAEKEERRIQTENLLTKSEMTLAEFLQGKVGKFAIQIPAEEVPSENGSPSYWRPGGLLLVESDGERIWPLLAVGKGSFPQAIEEARQLGTFLYLQSLNWEKPPYIRAISEENRKKVRLLWYLLQRGIKYLQEEEEILQEKTEMSRKATISPQEFFLEKKDGICFAEHSGAWRPPENGEVILNIFFLVERLEGKISLLKIPAHLQDFLRYLLERENEEGEAFSGIDYPLKAILKKIYGQVQKTVQIVQ